MHCALAGVGLEAYKSFDRRSQLPSFPRAGSGFTPLATLALALFEAMATDWFVSRYQAAGICTAGSGLLVERWQDIRDSSELYDRDILFGRVLAAGPRLVPVCGTLDEITPDFPDVISILLISATRVAGTIRARASRLDFDLTEFWANPTARQIEPPAFWAEQPAIMVAADRKATKRPPKSRTKKDR
jgi:hypothetical protein